MRKQNNRKIFKAQAEYSKQEIEQRIRGFSDEQKRFYNSILPYMETKKEAILSIRPKLTIYEKEYVWDTYIANNWLGYNTHSYADNP